LQEKMVADASAQLIIIADHSKLKDKLGAFPLPVEIIQYGWKQTQRRIETEFGIKTTIRKRNEQPYITDHGHYIVDCKFNIIADPSSVNTRLHLIPGVVETGLFINMCQKALIGYPDGVIKELVI
jgi:ribose 5-phosphate isomerase A